MSLKEQIVDFAIRNAIKYARKDFDRNAPKILNLIEKADVKRVNRQHMQVSTKLWTTQTTTG